VGIVTDPTNSVEVLNMGFRHQGCVLGLTSRSRDVGTSRLGLVSTKVPNVLVSVSDLCVSDLVSVSTQNVSGLVDGLGPFRLVEKLQARPT